MRSAIPCLAIGFVMLVASSSSNADGVLDDSVCNVGSGESTGRWTQDGDATQQALEKRYQDKLENSFMKKLEWVHEFDAAQTAAREKIQPILAYFTTSKDQNRGCQWVEENLFTDELKKLIGDKIVPYVNITAGLADKPDQGLPKDKSVESVPYLALMDRQGTVVHVFSPNDANAYSVKSVIGKVQELISARAGVDEAPKDKLARARLTLIEGFQKPAEADLKKMKKAARVKGLDSELIQRYEGFRARHPVLLVEAEYDAYVNRPPKKPIQSFEDYNRFQGEQRKREKIADVKAGEKVYKLYRKKKLRITEAEDSLHWRFWRWAFIGARREGDKRTAKRVFAYIEEHFESDSALRSQVMEFRALLDEMK